MPLWTPDELARVDLDAFKKTAANVWRVRFDVTQPDYCAEKIADVNLITTPEGIDYMLSMFDAEGCRLFLELADRSRVFIPAGLRVALHEHAAYA